MIAFLRILGVLFILVGGIWTYRFGFTDFRAHLAYIGLPLGISTLLVGVAMIIGPTLIRNLRRRRGGSR